MVFLQKFFVSSYLCVLHVAKDLFGKDWRQRPNFWLYDIFKSSRASVSLFRILYKNHDDGHYPKRKRTHIEIGKRANLDTMVTRIIAEE